MNRFDPAHFPTWWQKLSFVHKVDDYWLLRIGGLERLFRKGIFRVLQAQTLPNATPPIGKIPPLSQIAVTLEPVMEFWCPWRFMAESTISNQLVQGGAVTIFSRPGRSQGLLCKHIHPWFIHWLIHQFIRWSFSLPQLYGAATTKRVKIGLPVIK